MMKYNEIIFWKYNHESENKYCNLATLLIPYLGIDRLPHEHTVFCRIPVLQQYVCMYVWSSQIAEYGSTG